MDIKRAKMKTVIFVRHTFRGPSNITGDIKIHLPEDIVLNIPGDIVRIYNEDAVQRGISERAKTFAQNREEEIQKRGVIADLATQRTFETGKTIADVSKLAYLRGIPTVVNVNVDPVVSAFTLPDSEQIQKDRIAAAKALYSTARKTAKAFLKNLGLDVPLKSETSGSSAWQLLDLPNLMILVDTVVMSAGYPYQGGLVQMLEDAGWNRPSCPEILAQQAQDLIGIQHQIDNPPGISANYTAATPAKYILDRGKYIAVSHDSVVIPLLSALGIINPHESFAFFPFQEIRFEFIEDHIQIMSIRFAIDKKTGSILTNIREAPVFLGSVPIDRVEKLAVMALPVSKRVKIPLT